MTQAGVSANMMRIMGKNGLKKRDVAERAGFKAQQLNDMLHGRKVIRAEYLPRLAAALFTSVDELLREE